MLFNTNDRIRFELNEHGKKYLRDFINLELMEMPIFTDRHPLRKWLIKGEVIEAQLHEFMNVFGPMYVLGGMIPTVGNNIEIIEPEPIEKIIKRAKCRILETHLL